MVDENLFKTYRQVFLLEFVMCGQMFDAGECNGNSKHTQSCFHAMFLHRIFIVGVRS